MDQETGNKDKSCEPHRYIVCALSSLCGVVVQDNRIL